MPFKIPKIFKPAMLPLAIIVSLFSTINPGLGVPSHHIITEIKPWRVITSDDKPARNQPKSGLASYAPLTAIENGATAVSGFPPKAQEIPAIAGTVISETAITGTVISETAIAGTVTTETVISGTAIAGIWSGDLNAAGMQLKLEFEIKEVGTNAYRSYLSVPQQGAKDLPMDKTIVDKTKITIKSTVIGAVFEGEWDEQNRIKGVFTQNNHAFPLELVRGGTKLSRPQTPQAPLAYRFRNVQFSNSKGTCRFQGTLSTPKSGTVKGNIILFSGSGAQNRDEEIFGHKPFAVLADTFTKAGYNVLRVDDRGAGYTLCKPSELERFTTQDLIDDGKAYLKFVRDSVDAALPIILFGHSEGCAIIAALAQNNPEIQKLIGFGPALVSGAEINTHQNQTGVQAVLQDSNLTAHYMRLHRQILTLTQNEALFNVSSDSLKQYIDPIYAIWTKSTPPRYRRKIEKRFAKIAKTPFTDYLLKSYHPLFQNAWMWHFLNSNAREDWQRVSQPTLLINGSLDIQTPVALNKPAFEQYLSPNSQLQYTVLPQINHLFQKAKTGDIAEYGQIETTIDSEVLRVIFEFLEKD